MENVKTELRKSFRNADIFLDFKHLTSMSLSEWCEPLLSAMTEDGAIAYLIDNGEKKRFRASPLASTITWLNKAGLLSDEANRILRDKLLYLRDHGESTDPMPGERQKKPEDQPGWSLSEGVSVWSTSLALTALIGGGDVNFEKASEYKQSILWLAKQKKADGLGWGYQCWKNCEENVPMTSLALRALALAFGHSDIFGFDEGEREVLELAIGSGFRYLKDNVQYAGSKTEIYWKFREKGNCAATIWALLALKEIASLRLKEEYTIFYDSCLKKGLNYVVAHMPKKEKRWHDEQIVCEAGAKYNAQKNYYSFSATLLLEMMELGVSPYNSRVIGQISWLIHQNGDWKIQEYDRRSQCSFTYAMVIATLAKWASMVGKENSARVLQKPSGIFGKVTAELMGMPNFKGTDMQMFRKTRAVTVWLCSLLILVAMFVAPPCVSRISVLVRECVNWYGQEWNTIFINVISTFTYLVIISVFGLIGKLISKMFRWAESRIRG